MRWQSRLNRVEKELSDYVPAHNLKAIAAKYAFAPGTPPPELPDDATQAERDFVNMLVEMNHRTCPLPPEKIEV